MLLFSGEAEGEGWGVEARGDEEAMENWQKQFDVQEGNIASHLWQKRGKGEFVERHVGKSELAEAAAAHAPEQEVWVKEAKHFWEDREREFGLAILTTKLR